MKKVLTALVAMLGLTFNMSAQNPGSDNGFGLRLHVGIPSEEYGCPESTSTTVAGVTNKTENTYSGAMFGLDLNNRWYVWHNDKMGVAVDAHWLDLSIGAGEFESKNSTTSKILNQNITSISYKKDVVNCEMGFLGVGPMFTYYIGHDMAVDGYYNIVPTYMAAFVEKGGYDDDDDDVVYGGFAFTHNVGAAFRWKFLQAGLEYRLGNVEMEDYDSDHENSPYYEYDSKLNGLKVFFGFKF